MTITLDDFLGLVDMVKPEDWTLSKEKHFNFEATLHCKQKDIKLLWYYNGTYSDTGFFSPSKLLAQIYVGTLTYDCISKSWSYICPTEAGRKKVAEEGDFRLKAKYEEIAKWIEKTIDDGRERTEAELKDLLSSRQRGRKNGNHY